VNCGTRSYFYYFAFNCLLYSLCLLYSHTITIFHSIRSFLYFKQTGKIDNLIVSWEQSIWLYCVQVLHCSWQSKAWTRRLINCPDLSRSKQASPSVVWLFPTRFDKPWFLTEGIFFALLIIPSSWGSQLDGDSHQPYCNKQ
jgi:hypothetical protein